jgi:flagellar biosynthesis protein FlhG
MDQAADLRALVQKAASPCAPAVARPSGCAATRRVVVFGGKGGVGATTIALNLATALAQQGERCMLFDAAGGDVAQQLRLEPQCTLADALEGNHGLEEVVSPGPAGIQVVPSTPDLVRWHDKAEHGWNRLLAQLPSISFRPETVVIDAGNRPDPLARLLWQAADRVLLVSTGEPATIMNAYASIKLLNDSARSASIALLLNRSRDATAADEAQRRLLQACRRFLGLPLRNVATVPEDSIVPQCAARGEAFVLAVPASAASLGLRQAARAIKNQTARKLVAA